MREVRNDGRLWFPRHTARSLRALGAGWTLVGVFWIALGNLISALDGDVFFGVMWDVIGALWMAMGACWFLAARQHRHRERAGAAEKLQGFVPAGRVLASISSAARPQDAHERSRT
jgi:hypothetical protein